MTAGIGKSLTGKSPKTDHVIVALVLVELDYLQDYITMSVRL